MKVNITAYDYRTDTSYTEIDLNSLKELLTNSRNIKSFIYDVQSDYDLEFVKSDDIIFLYFSHSFLDVTTTFVKDTFSYTILENLKNGTTKKVIFFLEDMDFNSNENNQLIIVRKLNAFFGEHINKVFIQLTNYNWKFDWENLNIQYGFGCFPYVFAFNYLESEKHNLIETTRQKHFFSNQNEPRNARLYFYKFLMDNNLLDKFEYSFFFKYADKKYINSELTESNDTLVILDPVIQFPVKTFDNETSIDFYKKIKTINFEKNLNGYIDIVFETALFNKDFFGFSEKAFKSIICKKPFIIFGSLHTYRGLKELGFKTFPYLLDETKLDSGFEEWDFIGRLEWFFNEIKRISEIPLDDIKKMYSDHIDDYEYNYNLLKKLIKLEKEKLYNLLTNEENPIVKTPKYKRPLI
jgi:hypothetical protein